MDNCLFICLLIYLFVLKGRKLRAKFFRSVFSFKIKTGHSNEIRNFTAITVAGRVPSIIPHAVFTERYPTDSFRSVGTLKGGHTDLAYERFY